MQSKKKTSQNYSIIGFGQPIGLADGQLHLKKYQKKCVSFSIKFVVFRLTGVSSEIPHVKDPVQEVKPE